MVRTFEPTNIHTVKLIDLPLMRRLTERGVLLDSELVCTREVIGASNVLLSSILPQRGVYTLVGRAGRQKIVGQFRLRTDLPLAQMIFVAPDADADDSALLHLLDGVAVEAGKRGAHMLMAEVDEDSALFETLRIANFAVYARQTLWRWMGDPARLPEPTLTLDEITDADIGEINALFASIVPSLIQPVAAPSEDSGGWLYRRPAVGDDRVRLSAYIAYAKGRGGGYIMPYIAGDVVGAEAESLLTAALLRATAERQSLFVCLRRYQGWLDRALDAVGFMPFKDQAVMVRHIAAGVRHAQFGLTPMALESLPRAVRPPSRSSVRLRVGVADMPDGAAPTYAVDLLDESRRNA